MEFEYLHEVVCVELQSTVSRPLFELSQVFENLEFTLHDDVVIFDRNGNIPLWQRTSVISVEITLEGEEVFGFEEGEWDTIRAQVFVLSSSV